MRDMPCTRWEPLEHQNMTARIIVPLAIPGIDRFPGEAGLDPRAESSLANNSTSTHGAHVAGLSRHVGVGSLDIRTEIFELMLSVLSYDFIGTNPDESSIDFGSVQVRFSALFHLFL